MESFNPSGIRLWNQLPKGVTCAKSLMERQIDISSISYRALQLIRDNNWIKELINWISFVIQHMHLESSLIELVSSKIQLKSCLIELESFSIE